MAPLLKALSLVLLVSCLAFAGSHAGWIENGVPLTRQWGATGEGVIAPDGSSGAIIAYQACREGVSHIIAQRINSLGIAQWGRDGIDISTATGNQLNFAITSDGAGGAIVTWEDYRNGNCDIYAQRVNASGAVQWAADGVAICTATRDQLNPAIVSDGAGGAMVTWQDYRSGTNYDIYAQRVDASGAVQWTADGVAICTATRDQLNPAIVFDGAGGAMVTWQDYRSPCCIGVYAQRVNASGAVQWTTDGVALRTAVDDQMYPQITSDGSGGAIVTWLDYISGPSYIVYAQRVNASGVVQWTADAVALCTATASSQSNGEIVSDGAGGAIVTWVDTRAGYADIYAQRVDASGAVQWVTNGVAICTAADYQELPQIASDGAGGAYVSWVDDQSGNWDIYAQRVNASGAVQWTARGVPLCTAARDQLNPTIVCDGAGDAIVTWQDARGGTYDIYAQRVNATGAVQWAVDGVALCAGLADQHYPQITSDGASGAIVTWQGYRSLDEYGIYAQRTNASGAVQWTADGVALCTANGDKTNPTIVSDGAGGAIVTWQDYSSGTYDIYAQRVNASGAVQWTADGVALCTGAWNQVSPTIASDGAGGAIVMWLDARGADLDIYAQRVNASGAVQWTAGGVALCTATGDQQYPTITSDGAGGAIVTWSDYRNGTYPDIYTQRVNASGTAQWTANGAALCAAALSQSFAKMVSDGAGGAIVTWQDRRSGTYDIYAQRVSGSGTVQWMTDGIPLCTATGDQRSPTITSDGVGGAIVTWLDARGADPDIYVQRVSASGAVQWTANGVAICMATGSGPLPQIISDGAGGGIVSWYDQRSGNYDIYAQSVNAAGAVQWTADGVALCTAAGNQLYPRITSDGDGGAIVVWEDDRCESLIYAQRVRASGEIVSTLLQDYAAARAARGIRINWSLSEMDGDARFSILRASAPDWRFIELEGVAIEKKGLSFACTDESCLAGSTYKYRVVSEVGEMGPRVLFETDAIIIPALPVTLYQNHPNPFNPQTVIRFYLPETQEITLDVYNVAGERMVRLAQGKKEKGYHEVTWDGRNSSGTVCSSGVYFSRLKAGKSAISRKIVIMR